jgi:hypothetical protein
MINRSNYEIVFVDYFDDKLDKNQVDELFQFLQENPDLKNEFDFFSGNKIEPDTTLKFPGKENLKKASINEANYKTWMVAFIENDISQEGHEELIKFIKDNPAYGNEIDILKKTKLIPDYSIILDKKNTLKKNAKVIQFHTPLKRIVSIAAALILIALSYFIIKQFNAPETIVSDYKNIQANPDIAKNNNEPVKELSMGNKKVYHPKVGNKIISPQKQIANRDKNNINSINKISIKNIQTNQNTVQEQDIASSQSFAKSGNEKINSDFNMDGNVNVHVNRPVINVQKADLSSAEYAEIFSDEELKDLKELQNKKFRSEEEAKRFSDIAREELNKLSKKTDIKFAKRSDPGSNSITYAFGLGKIFSVSHTSSRQ